MKRWFLRITLFLLWGGLIAGGYVAYDAHRFLTTPASGEPQEFLFTIAPGATFDRVAWDLKKAGAITDVPRFRLLAQFNDSLGKVRAGEFMISTGWTPEQVLRQVTQGQAVLYKLSLREGLTWWETARAIEAQGFARYEDFKDVIHDPEFLREWNIPFANAEGFLFPETYLMKKPRSPLDREQAYIVASTLVGMFWKKTEPLWTQLPAKDRLQASGTLLPRIPGAMQSPPTTSPGQASPQEPGGEAAPAPGQEAIPQASSGITADVPAPDRQDGPRPDQAAAEETAAGAPPEPVAARADISPEALRRWVILASLVEKETGVPEERARVSGVYANRLRLGMLLQCDPTIIYGVGESFSGAIRRSQLNDPKNLYNTYVHPGLTPGPICSSGLASLKAAFQPETHEFLYFVATGIDAGHTFSKTLAEHNKAVQVYRARMRARSQ